MPFLRYSPGSHMGRRVNTLLKKSADTLQFRSVMESSLTDLLKVMALRGKGIAWLPDYAMTDELRCGQLQPLGGEEWCIAVDVVLYRNDVRLHAGAERFWSLLAKQCAAGWLLPM